MLVLMGEMAVGKDAIKKELIQLGMENVITTTTRPMRNGEKQDISYHFVSEDYFLEMNKQGLLAESTVYDTVYGKWYYGSQHKDLENHRNKVIILNPDGVKTLKNKIIMEKWTVIRIACPIEIIKERLKFRGDNPKEIKRRLEADALKFQSIENFIDCSVINDGSKTPKELAKEIKTLYEKECLKWED